MKAWALKCIFLLVTLFEQLPESGPRFFSQLTSISAFALNFALLHFSLISHVQSFEWSTHFLIWEVRSLRFLSHFTPVKRDSVS